MRSSVNLHLNVFVPGLPGCADFGVRLSSSPEATGGREAIVFRSLARFYELAAYSFLCPGGTAG